MASPQTSLPQTPAELLKVPSINLVIYKLYFQVITVRVEKRLNEIVNRLNKTKVEKHPDFRTEREERDALEREDQKAIAREQKKLEKEEADRKAQEAELR